jgi:hypothetical protein
LVFQASSSRDPCQESLRAEPGVLVDFRPLPDVKIFEARAIKPSPPD